MSKRSFSITDKNNRLLNYYLNRSDKDWNLVINEAIKNYVCDHLSQKQIQEAIKHTVKISKNFVSWKCVFTSMFNCFLNLLSSFVWQ